MKKTLTCLLLPLFLTISTIAYPANQSLNSFAEHTQDTGELLSKTTENVNYSPVETTSSQAPGTASESNELGKMDQLLELAGGCCKICKKGKACGNSCIAQNKACHKGAGCACNASN